MRCRSRCPRLLVLQATASEGAECPVCLCEVPQEGLMRFPCQHGVCKPCFDLMSRYEGLKTGTGLFLESVRVQCPMCRSSGIEVDGSGPEVSLWELVGGAATPIRGRGVPWCAPRRRTRSGDRRGLLDVGVVHTPPFAEAGRPGRP